VGQDRSSHSNIVDRSVMLAACGDAGCLRYAGRARRARSEKLYSGTVTTCGKEKEKADTRREHF